jgi:NADH-quinone oxidoreductase subunit J
MMAELVFYLLAGLLIISALTVVLAQNPVHSVMALIFAFLNGASLLIMTGLEFFPIIWIIVYVGAVVILFLFIVMTISTADQRKGFQWTLLPFFMTFALVLVKSLSDGSFIAGKNHADFSAKALGLTLYSDYFLQFQLAGLILLVALIGIIVIAQREDQEGVKKQSVWKQLTTSPGKRITLIKDKK